MERIPVILNYSWVECYDRLQLTRVREHLPNLSSYDTIDSVWMNICNIEKNNRQCINVSYIPRYELNYNPMAYYKKFTNIILNLSEDELCRLLFTNFPNSVLLWQLTRYKKLSLPIFLSYKITLKENQNITEEDFAFKCICIATSPVKYNKPLYLFMSGINHREYKRENQDDNIVVENICIDVCPVVSQDNTLFDQRIIMGSTSLESLLRAMYQVIDPIELEHLMYCNDDNIEIKELLKCENEPFSDICHRYIIHDYMRKHIFTDIRLQKYFCKDVEGIILKYI